VKENKGGRDRSTPPPARSFGGQQWPAAGNSLRRLARERRGRRACTGEGKGCKRAQARVSLGKGGRGSGDRGQLAIDGLGGRPGLDGTQRNGRGGEGVTEGE
jgi:hypothetical protein